MKNLLSLLVILSVQIPVHAIGIGGGSVSAKVVDQSGKPVEFAVVTILHKTDSSLVKGEITDEKGQFLIHDIDDGTYVLSITASGFDKYMSDSITVNNGHAVTLPDIKLVPVKAMKEVEIIAVQPLYTQKPDKLIMNVENSPVKIIGTAWDLLSTVPGVMIDQNNNITLRGKSGVRIYFDGRNSFLAGDQLVSYMQNISASDVVSIEIISNPSAKYDADGAGGILNLITKKGSQQGFNGSVRAGIGQSIYTKYDGGVLANYAKEKFNIYGKYDFANRNYLDRTYIDRNIRYNGNTTNFNQHTSNINHPYGNTARLGVDFYAKHNIMWGGRVDGSLANERNHTINSTVITDQNNDSVSQLYQLNQQRVDFNNLSGNLYYNQKFDTLGKELSASADYLTYHNLNKDNFDLSYSDGNGGTIAPSELQTNRAQSDISIFVSQVDYAHPFGTKYKLETGMKTSYVQTSNDLLFTILTGSNWITDTSRSNKFIYKEQINAAYLTGDVDLGEWQFMGGVRAEQTLSDGQSPTTGQELKKSYLQLFPSVFVLKKFGKLHALNITYARRVNRPDYNNLNPFKYYLDKYTYQLGNPYLQPETSDQADITYSYIDALFVTAAGSITHHAMIDVTNQIDSTGVGYQTTVNLQSNKNANFSLSCPVPIGNWFMMENGVEVNYSRFQSPLFGSVVDMQSWNYSVSTNMTFSLPADLKIQSWGWYRSPSVYGVYHMRSVAGVGCGFSKSFLNKQLQLNLTFMDIFRTNGMRINVNYQNQDLYLRSIPESPRAYFRIRYSFGNQKAKRDDQNKSGADDLKGRTGK